MIYLDNAATTLPKPPEVGAAMLAALNSFGNSGRSAHPAGLTAARLIYRTRTQVARLFNCPRPEQVVFTANATEALNLAIGGLLGPGDHIISTVSEHNSVLRPLFRLEDEAGAKLSFAPVDSFGRLDHDAFSRLLRPDTRAIVCTHASNLTGNLTDLARIGRLAKAHGLYFIVDAAQTAGSVPIDMQALGIDALCFTGHKGLLGPQGTGGLCLADGVQPRPLKVGGSGVQSYSRQHPSRLPTALEAGTLNAHALAGLSAALTYIESRGVENIRAYEERLTRRFYQGLMQIPAVTVYGNLASLEPKAAHAPIVSLNLGQNDSALVADALATRFDIAVRAGAHCAPLLHKALGTEEQGAVRFSFSCFTTEEDIDAALNALEELAHEK